MYEPMNGAVPPTDGANEEPTTPPANPFQSFIDHQRKALEETGKALDALLPNGFKEHSAEAGREFVKGVKVLVDAAITELERAQREVEKGMNNRRAPESAPQADDRPSSTGANKVKVQVD